MQLYTVHEAISAPVRIRHAEHLRRPRDPYVVDVRHHQPARTLLGRVAGDVDASEPHRAAARHQEHRTLVDDAHLQVVRTERIMVVGAEGRDDAADRLRKRTLEERVAIVGQEAPHLHHDGRQIDVRRLAADRVPGVADGLQLVAGDVEGRLQSDALADAELSLPFLAHLAHDPRNLVAEHRRPCGDVARYALVPCTQRRSLVVAETNGVRDQLDDDAFFARRFELDIL